MIEERHELVKSREGMTVTTYEFPDMNATFYLGWDAETGDPGDEDVKRLQVRFWSDADEGDIFIKLPGWEKEVSFTVFLGIGPYSGSKKLKFEHGLSDEDIKRILQFIQKKCIEHAKQLLDWVEMDETWEY